MGLAVSKRTHISAKHPVILHINDDVEYSLSFTGYLMLNIPKKNKEDSYNCMREMIQNSMFWKTYIQELMNDASLEEKIYIGNIPISNVEVILNEDDPYLRNSISGMLYWKSIPVRIGSMANSIIQKTINKESKIVVKESNMRFSYEFIPGGLRI